jgi:hypothetical protein
MRRFKVCEEVCCTSTFESIESSILDQEENCKASRTASLSKYGSSQDSDTELKRAAIHGVILLAPLM